MAQQKKPIESRQKRIEEQLTKLEAKKVLIDAELAAPDAYREEQRETLRQRLIDQAYLAREIEQLEADWLTQQTMLERLTA